MSHAPPYVVDMHTTDARGLRCPMPLVMAKTAMESVPAGQELTVLATDPEAAIDLAAWAADQGYVLTERTEDDWTEYVLRAGTLA